MPGLVFKEDEKNEGRPRESLSNAEKREKKQVNVKLDAEVLRRKEQGRRLRQQARRLSQQASREKQHERQVRKRARQARKKGEKPLLPEKTEKAKQKRHKGKVVDQKVKSILMRAPLEASKKLRSSGEEKAEKVKGSADHGWKAGSRKAESEIAPARRSKKVSTSLALSKTDLAS